MSRQSDLVGNPRLLQYVVAQYPDLHGLRLVPFALLLLGFVTLERGWLLGPVWLVDTPLLLVLGTASALALSTAITTVYERHYGRVEPGPDDARRTQRWTLVCTGMVVLGVLADPPLHIVGLTAAVLLLAYYWPKQHFARHWIVIAAGVALVSLLVPLGLSSVAMQGACGGLVVLGGLADHLLLVRTLPPLPEDGDDATV